MCVSGSRSLPHSLSPFFAYLYERICVKSSTFPCRSVEIVDKAFSILFDALCFILSECFLLFFLFFSFPHAMGALPETSEFLISRVFPLCYSYSARASFPLPFRLFVHNCNMRIFRRIRNCSQSRENVIIPLNLKCFGKIERKKRFPRLCGRELREIFWNVF